MEKNQEWMKEEYHLQSVYNKLTSMKKQLMLDETQTSEEKKKVVGSLSCETKINHSTASDSFDSLIEVELRNQELAQLNFKTESNRKKSANIHQLLDSAYFAKIDVRYPEETEIEPFYIGAAGVSDEYQEQLVYDWRSPIASLYYDNKVGATTYEAPAGTISVELENRRQLKVKEDKLLHFFDTNTAIEDQMLLEVLSEQSSSQLKNITSTIQSEQNQIIRDTKSEILLVEGIAGSGKTSTILQRIAFLLYRYREDLSPNQVLLLSPNAMFSQYIQEVLPSLGEKNPTQFTYRQLLKRNNSQYVSTIEQHLEESANSSLENMEKIENFVQSLSFKDLPIRDIMLGNQVIIKRKWIFQLVKNMSDETPLYQKILYIQDKIEKQLSSFVGRASKQSYWIQRADGLSNLELKALKRKYKEFDEKNKEKTPVQLLVEDALYKINKKVEEHGWIHLKKLYQQATGTPLHEHGTVDQMTEYLYLKQLLIQDKYYHSFKYVIIDEIQDYSPTQLYFLSKIFGKAQMTLVGDGYQAIFQQGTQFKEIQQIFEKNGRKTTVRRLLKSYRSSAPISEFMKALVGGEASGIEIVERSGAPVEIKPTKNEAEYMESLQGILTSEEKVNSTVILTKDKEEARELHDLLTVKYSREISLISDETTMKKNENCMIMPIYLAKGLEFDKVIIHNASSKNYVTQRDLHMLYTASSRAMHHLYVPYIQTPSKFLPTI